MARVQTGNVNLDYILTGGLPEYTINLIIGLSGSGKTILTNSIMYHNASPEKKALFITTVAEPLNRLLRFVQEFTFFKPEAVGEYIYYEPLGDILSEEGLEAGIKKIEELIRHYNPTFLAIDSFKAFHVIEESHVQIARLISRLATFLSALPITSFWVGGYTYSEIADLPEFVVADSIIELSLEKVGVKQRRYLEVMKIRGSGYIGGENSLNINENGIDIFPRLIVPTPAEYVTAKEKFKTGVDVLDEMVDGGLFQGSSTIIFGPTGVGKTLLSLHTIFKGVESGEQGLIVTLDQDPVQLRDFAAGFGWDIAKAEQEGLLEIMYFPPDAAYIDEVGRQVFDALRKRPFKQIMIDSLNDLEAMALKPEIFRGFMYALTHTMAINAVSTIMTYEVRELFGTRILSEYGISNIVDNVILLNYITLNSDVERLITVLKTRRSYHDPKVHKFTITSEGLQIKKQPAG
ncbi:MAG: hypothetical protein IBX64_04650 [Actinobacteria bacterium]|nr:hypothetical protein [Actinomycetota bacterium]